MLLASCNTCSRGSSTAVSGMWPPAPSTRGWRGNKCLLLSDSEPPVSETRHRLLSGVLGAVTQTSVSRKQLWLLQRSGRHGEAASLCLASALNGRGKPWAVDTGSPASTCLATCPDGICVGELPVGGQHHRRRLAAATGTSTSESQLLEPSDSVSLRAWGCWRWTPCRAVRLQPGQSLSWETQCAPQRVTN